jgi:hypothetical protein
MPVIHNIPLSLNTGEVLRWQGFRKQSGIRPEIKSIIVELLAKTQEDGLLKPAVAYEIYPSNGKPAAPPAFSHLLPPEAREFAVVIGTIGPGLEKRAADYNRRGETLLAVLLDGIGSAAVDSLTHEACSIIEAEASTRGYRIACPVSPGAGSFPITEQRNLFKMVHSEEIGVRLTSSEMMVPVKSISMVIGMGPEMKKYTRAGVCAVCNLGKTCRYRMNS